MSILQGLATHRGSVNGVPLVAEAPVGIDTDLGLIAGRFEIKECARNFNPAILFITSGHCVFCSGTAKALTGAFGMLELCRGNFTASRVIKYPDGSEISGNFAVKRTNDQTLEVTADWSGSCGLEPNELAGLRMPIIEDFHFADNQEIIGEMKGVIVQKDGNLLEIKAKTQYKMNNIDLSAIGENVKFAGSRQKRISTMVINQEQDMKNSYYIYGHHFMVAEDGYPDSIINSSTAFSYIN